VPATAGRARRVPGDDRKRQGAGRTHRHARSRDREACTRGCRCPPADDHPDIGPITATAILALAPPPQSFRKGRDFAAWVGLTPLQRSTGGKQKLGEITKMGERTLRRLLIIGSAAVVLHAARRGAPQGSWLEQMLARKPRMLVTVALANKTARIVWAVLASGKDYRAPLAAA
jgi:transposase